LPIAVLGALILPIPISEETVLRLRQAGIRTLGQLARLDELTLRRQFGAVGTILAALAHGDTLTAFHSTPPEPTLRFRTRFSTTLSVEQTLRRLPGLASEITTRLQALNQAMGALTLTVWWESGGVERVQHTLAEPTQEVSTLTQRLTSLLLSLARPQSMRSAAQNGDIERLDVRVTRLAPLRPQQCTLWSTPRQLRSERRRKIATLAETLAQRHHRPLLLASHATNEAATFSEDRYRLTPLSADTPLDTPAEVLSPPANQRTGARQGERLITLRWW
jgi:nucleotidyltransferase/DNA polymerase involved in DNA repair